MILQAVLYYFPFQTFSNLLLDLFDSFLPRPRRSVEDFNFVITIYFIEIFLSPSQEPVPKTWFYRQRRPS